MLVHGVMITEIFRRFKPSLIEYNESMDMVKANDRAHLNQLIQVGEPSRLVPSRR